MKRWFFLLVLAAGVGSCKRQVFRSPGGSTGDSGNVYAVGYVYDFTSNHAVIWKNGVATPLPPNTNANDNSFAYCVAVSGNDVYVTGESPLGRVLWKNGVSQPLPSDCTGVTAIQVIGSDIYMAGMVKNPNDYTKGLAAMWKNGSETILSPGIPQTSATGIMVLGNDVYVSGTIFPPGTYGYAAYWKNGQLFQLTRDTVFANGWSIFVSGQDVYVTGNLNSGEPVYWKNGTAVALDGPPFTGTGWIGVIGNDVYVLGGVNKHGMGIYNAVYWKNGQMSYLVDTSSQSEVTCATINGKDWYAGGMVARPKGPLVTDGFYAFEATYWRNGTAVTLPYPGASGYHYVFGITVGK